MTNTKLKPIVILGAGAWGSALAIHLGKRGGQEVRLWDINSLHLSEMEKRRSNIYLDPNCLFPEDVVFYDNLEQALDGVCDVLCAVPSQFFPEMLVRAKGYFGPSVRLLWVTKGIDSSCRLLSEIATEILGDCPLALLSGPSFAVEVAQGLPTAIVLATNNRDFCHSLMERLHHNSFRPYPSDDLVGVQLGGALKNIYAIASGIADGLQFGCNARCALITRGLVEMQRLGVAMGARAQTFVGLSGLGDLVLTCTDNQSRNRRFGLMLGEGNSVEEAEKAIQQVIEGKSMLDYTVELAKRFAIEMPIAEQLFACIHGRISPKEALNNLLSRSARKAEF